jgi:hypothetical protein
VRRRFTCLSLATFDQMDYVPLYRCLFPSMPMFKVHRMSGVRSLLGGSQSSSQSNTLSGVSAMLLLTATQKFRAEFLIIWFKKMATPADWKTLLGDGPLTKKQHIVKVLHTLICEWLVAAFEDATGTIPKKRRRTKHLGCLLQGALTQGWWRKSPDVWFYYFTSII